jgi:hypothetical protein
MGAHRTVTRALAGLLSLAAGLSACQGSAASPSVPPQPLQSVETLTPTPSPSPTSSPTATRTPTPTPSPASWWEVFAGPPAYPIDEVPWPTDYFGWPAGGTLATEMSLNPPYIWIGMSHDIVVAIEPDKAHGFLWVAISQGSGTITRDCKTVFYVNANRDMTFCKWGHVTIWLKVWASTYITAGPELGPVDLLGVGPQTLVGRLKLGQPIIAAAGFASVTSTSPDVPSYVMSKTQIADNKATLSRLMATRGGRLSPSDRRFSLWANTLQFYPDEVPDVPSPSPSR